MKRLILILLTLLMLAGCSANPTEEPETTTTLPEESTAVTEKPGFYDPDSAVEKETDGAVRAYPLGQDNCTGVKRMGEDLVLFTAEETGTCLTLLSGENLSAETEVLVNTYIFPYDPFVQVNEQGIAYFDSTDESVVFLNTEFQETRRVLLPEDIQGMPLLTEDWSTVYYCTDTAIVRLNLDTGISGLVRDECDCQWQTLQQLCQDDQILKWYEAQSDTEGSTFYISAQTGEILYSTELVTDLATGNGWYYARICDGSIPDYLFGRGDSTGRVLTPLREDSAIWPALELGALVTVSTDETGCNLDYYDLESGSRTASVHLDCDDSILRVTADPLSGEIWLLYYDMNTFEQILYRWQPERSAVTDPADYTSPYYTAEAPDVDGLEACRSRAEALSGEYDGIEILIWDDTEAYEPWDFTFETEYKVPAFEQGLTALDQALSRYPDGFLRKLADRTDSGAVRILLVRSISGDAEKGTISTAGGVQYWLDGDAYVAVVLDSALEQNLYHELFHLIDTYVLSSCGVYDDWNDLNPAGFEYDYDYIQNESRLDFQYLNDDQRAFIDMYSMSFPGEDRARIMEFAMLPDNEAYFRTETMQQKLLKLCQGIRTAFELEELEEELPWEVYLMYSLVPEEKG